MKKHFNNLKNFWKFSVFIRQVQAKVDIFNLEQNI